MISHNKDVVMDLKLKNFEFSYNTFCLIMFKNLVYMQIVFNNYNFNTYKEYMKQVVKVLEKRSKTGMIDVKEVKKSDVVFALDQYLQKERKRAFDILLSPKKKDLQRKIFKPERDLYEITQNRSYQLESGVMKLYDMENKVRILFHINFNYFFFN